MHEAKGYRVRTVRDGSAAVHAVHWEPFHVILSDIQTPGMTGVDLLRIVRAYDLDVPVILMTGAPSIEMAMEAVSLGALQYIAKPIPNDVLLNAVERASRLHRMASMKREALALVEGAGPRWATAPGSERGSTEPSRRCGSASSPSRRSREEPRVPAPSERTLTREETSRTR